DCTQCHQPSGPDGEKLLRMQELTDPWTHFFRADRPGGKALLADFHAAHGDDEGYGFVPAALIDKSDPRQLEFLVERNGFADQPNPFDTGAIEAEVEALAPLQPAINVPVGASPTWRLLYVTAAAGLAIPVPYHDVKVTDPSKLTAMSDAYRQFKAGQLPREKFPSIRDVFLDA